MMIYHFTVIIALIQCSGEAIYMNDILTTDNSVYCAFVSATKVGAVIEQIDATNALKMPGVIAFYTSKDIPGSNTTVEPALGYEIEELFTSNIVRFYDQPLGMIVALTSDIANKAATKVKVIYSKNNQVIMPTLKDVLANKRLDRIHKIVPSKLKDIKLSAPADVKGKGTFELGPQYHFTLEPITCVTIPIDNGLQVWSTTQWMDHTQSVIAKMLQMKAADVQMKVRRLGGGYGCKISRANAVACATAQATALGM